MYTQKPEKQHKIIFDKGNNTDGYRFYRLSGKKYKNNDYRPYLYGSELKAKYNS